MVPAAPVPPTPAPVVAGPPEATPPATLDAQALESTATTLPSKVTKVTVYSDRARVTRVATTELTTEPTVYAFRGLPGWVDDGSVRVAASAGRIVDVRVERAFLARSTDAALLKAEADHQLLTSRQASLTDELRVLEAQKQQIESIKAFSLEKITRDTTIGNVSVKSYGDVLAFIVQGGRALENYPEYQRVAVGDDGVYRVTDRRIAFRHRLSIGTITIGCALGYLDYRFGPFGWREQAPRLAAWYATLQARPSFKSTEAIDG